MRIFQVDAFTDRLFSGNPAAVIPLDEWLPDDTMQRIAAENNLSETAYLVPQGEDFEIRWFTPAVEVKLCGHATLASAHVIFHHLDFPGETIRMHSKSGLLTVTETDGFLKLNFPAVKSEPVAMPRGLEEALGAAPTMVYKSDDLLAVFNSEADIRSLQPDFALLKKLDARGIIVTAPGEEHDFVSRFFAPAVGVNEDPVTGSAHTKLMPYWSNRLNKRELHAVQLSHRGGELFCKMLDDDHVEIAGKAITYLEGTISL